MKVAAYQAPLEATSSIEVLGLIREQVSWCESNGVEILCCPEAVLGGLADNVSWDKSFAINVENGELQTWLALLVSNKLAIILGFTEIDRAGRLYNSAVVFDQGAIAGLYRKLHPAINKSVYQPGKEIPVFTIHGLTFGVMICNDSNYPEPATSMIAKRAKALFVPTNNALPPNKGTPELIRRTRNVDVRRAIENGVYVIRADVAGRTESLVSYGSSGIVDATGTLVQSARTLEADIVVADLTHLEAGDLAMTEPTMLT
jgi:predicted amidohydrolase